MTPEIESTLIRAAEADEIGLSALADLMEEEGRQAEADILRELCGGKIGFSSSYDDGCGYGNIGGDGGGWGYGDGYNYGDGCSYGDGDGDGYGHGDGFSHGDSYGDGEGYGGGDGEGHGYGSNSGSVFREEA